jgi:hypothetical protein
MIDEPYAPVSEVPCRLRLWDVDGWGAPIEACVKAANSTRLGLRAELGPSSPHHALTRLRCVSARPPKEMSPWNDPDRGSLESVFAT